MADPHWEYLLGFYHQLALKLLSGKLTPAQFAKALALKHLQIEERADYDGLLPAFLNNNGFAKALKRELAAIKRIPSLSGTLIAFDIDNLKRFNDTFGHVAGDKLLKTYARVIEEEVGIQDLKGRLGGDEFAVFVAGGDISEAKQLAGRIAERIGQEVKREFPKLEWKQTVSAGISVARKKDTALSLRRRVDQALYKAKKAKGKVVVA